MFTMIICVTNEDTAVDLSIMNLIANIKKDDSIAEPFVVELCPNGLRINTGEYIRSLFMNDRSMGFKKISFASAKQILESFNNLSTLERHMTTRRCYIFSYIVINSDTNEPLLTLVELPPLSNGSDHDDDYEENIMNFLDNQVGQGRCIIGLLETTRPDMLMKFISNFCAEPGSSSEHGNRTQSLRLSKFFYKNVRRMFVKPIEDNEDAPTIRCHREEGMVPFTDYFNITNTVFLMKDNE